jgi:hypothetical protein
MNLNWEQAKGLIRTVIVGLGGVAIAFGWLPAADLQFLTSDTFLAALGALGSLVVAGMGWWSHYTHSQTNAVAVVAAMPEVAEVKVAPTAAGRNLKDAVGSTPDALVTVAAPPPTTIVGYPRLGHTDDAHP